MALIINVTSKNRSPAVAQNSNCPRLVLALVNLPQHFLAIVGSAQDRGIGRAQIVQS